MNKPELDEDFSFANSAGVSGANVGKGLSNLARALMYAADRLASALETKPIPNVYPGTIQWQPYEQPYYVGDPPYYQQPIISQVTNTQAGTDG